MAKQNQANLDATSLSANDNLTDTAASLGTANDDSFETTTSQPEASASTAESSQPESAPRKSWLNQEELLKNVNQLPQSLLDLSNKAVAQLNGLSTTQKVAAGALLAGGIGWLALRGKKSKASSSIYAPYNPKNSKSKGTKWNSSSDSVYRGATNGLHDTGHGAEYGTYSSGTENGF
ncbi:hypothetical protein [Hymenobacter sp. YC55]|uniref:hypothetical protein n=1 Tax=Hymenobacter sp. YC55 TaxID=3034019 RepID=UPI0023F6A972|nr:hypothetical protein [Hymenobacter sp. YC55]MDF7814547.1 hypothetical protein [Hymenobacter sp. YC55]